MSTCPQPGTNTNDLLEDWTNRITQDDYPPTYDEIPNLNELTDMQIDQLDRWASDAKKFADSFDATSGELRTTTTGQIAPVVGGVASFLFGTKAGAAAELATNAAGAAAAFFLEGKTAAWSEFAERLGNSIELERDLREDLPGGYGNDPNFDNNSNTDTYNPNDCDPKRDQGGGVGDDLPLDSAFLNPLFSPLVIDLDGDGIELTALEGSQAYFDLNLDGIAQRTGWVHSDDALLAFDVNGNGYIDDNSELFGNVTGFNDGFAQLAQLDSNNDGIIDESDVLFSELLVWRDYNQDGLSDVGELQSLSDVNIASIDLNASETNETNQGHFVSHRSSVTFDDGSTELIEDIHFENDLRDTKALLPSDFEYSEQALLMPKLWGYGQIVSTAVALTLSEDLTARTQSLIDQLAVGDIASFKTSFDDFVLHWAGVNDVDPSSRGPNIDARHLAFLEKAYGTAYVSRESDSNPGVNTAPLIQELYDGLVEKLAGRFMAQSAISTALSVGIGNDQVFDVTAFNDHPLMSLTGLLEGYGPSSRSLNGELQDVLTGLAQAVENGTITALNASAAVKMLQEDLSADGFEFSTMLEVASKEAGLDPTSEFHIQLLYGDDFQITHGTETSDDMSSNTATYFDGRGGDDLLTSSQSGAVFLGGTGNDTLNGSAAADTYIYLRGHGSDVISDQSFRSVEDRLILLDFNQNEVFFTQDNEHNLLVTLPDGQTITVMDHFKNGSTEVELIEFADGTILNTQQVRDKSIKDQKADGAIILGSLFTENYYHAAGDGSYTINDFDYLAPDGTDTFTFTDLNQSDVTFSRGVGDDLIMALSNGETIIVNKQFDRSNDYAIEFISFADGTTLDAQSIRNKSVADMKSTGSVIGSALTENYYHAAGDGSYAINDYDYLSPDGTDTFTFTDLNQFDVTFGQGTSDDLIMALSNGETITIVNHFQEFTHNLIEFISFADSTTLDAQGIRDKSVADMKSAGTVLGTALSENYYHAAGDGSYTINDYDYLSPDGTDRLTFTDLNQSDATFSRGAGNDLVITLSNGEVITVVSHFHAFTDNLIEYVSFADGTTLDAQGIRDKSVADMKSTGIVLGTELAENYYHAAGDGSYTINDFDYLAPDGTDTFTFTDLNQSDVTFSRGVGDDLIMMLSNGETIIVNNQFDRSNDYAIEFVSFADGSTLDAQGIRAAALSGTMANDQLIGFSYDDVIEGFGGDDYIFGSSGNDQLFGGSGSDTIDGENGDDNHYGGDGDDVVMGSIGDDFFDGGSGNDTIDFSYSNDDFTIDLSLTNVVFANGFTEQVIGFENIIAGSGDNTLNGDGLNNRIEGRDGNDIISGGAGNDTLNGETGDDDHFGGDGDDLLIANIGADNFDGGNGIDTLDFTYYGSGAVIDLVQGTATFPNGVSEDVLNIENVIMGAGDDTLIGGSEANILDGGAGNDLVSAGAGDDRIIYHSGNDVLDGQNFGQDTLDLTRYTSDQVTFHGVDTDLLISTPDGNITVKGQMLYDVGDARSNIEVVIFSDGTLDEQGIQARIQEDQFAPNPADVVDLTEALSTIEVTSSSLYSTNNPASNLIDGVFGGSNWSSTNRSADEWYELDLQDTYLLTSVVVTARSSYGSRIEGAEVSLLNDAREVVHTFAPINGSGNGTVHEFEITSFVDARYVRLSQSDEYFNLSEVEVFARSGDPLTQLNATSSMDAFNFNDVSGPTVINDFEVGVDTLSIGGIDLTITGVDDLPAEFFVTSSPNDSVTFYYNNEGSVRLEGITEEEFFF